MKTRITLLLCALALACAEDDSTSFKKDTEIILAQGNWVITYYFDDTDETLTYNGFRFTFQQNGEVTAVKNSDTFNGTWSISSNSQDDSPDDIDFNLSFLTPDILEELTDDWDVLSVSTTKIELIDVSGGGGGTDYLTFELE